MTPDDLSTIRKRHTPITLGTDSTICSRDEGIWPCDAAKLRVEVDRLEADLFTANERVALIREAVVELEWGALTATDSVSREKVLDIIAATA